jgi:hypothetical protein
MLKSKKPKTERLPNHINGMFIRGPIPSIWWRVALDGGIGVAKVASAIWHVSGLKHRSRTVTLNNAIEMRRWGIDRHVKYRALRYLRKAGLITTTPKGQGCVEVTILCADGKVPGYEE